MLRRHFAAVALVLFALINVPLVGLIRDGLPHRWVKETERHHVKLFLRGAPEKFDSWYPMSVAYAHFLVHGADDLYEEVFFAGEAKFQYPPSALLLFSARSWMNPKPEQWARDKMRFYGSVQKNWVPGLARCTWVATLLTMASTVWLLVLGLQEGGRRLGRPVTTPELCVAGTAGAVLCLFFYPLVKAFSLGQVQPMIAAAFAMMLVGWWFGLRGLAGLLCGLVCLLKPQFGVFLVWAALRREWGFCGGFLASALTGTLLSVATFGMEAQWDYLRVLSFISRHGEGFYANESVNGMLNRAFFNGRNAVWDGSEFAPFHPVVYTGTLVSSLLVLALVLWPRQWRGDRFGGALDMSLCALGATVASPVAWEHHYSILPPIFAICFGAILARPRPAPALLCWLAVSFFLSSHYFDKMVLLAETGWNFLQTYRLAGVLMVLYLAWKIGNEGTEEGCETHGLA